MPNARPTQPGYYWARTWRGWEPVSLDDEFDVAQFGVGDFEEPDEVLEWGPAIPEYRGEGGG